jgi:hypothetical protein
MALRSAVILTLCISSLLPAPSAASQTAAQSPPVPDITQVDLFGAGGWNSAQISVMGFTLGMSRQEVMKAAQHRDVRLDDASGQGCLHAGTCDVFTGGRYSGVTLSFGDDQAVCTITVEAYRRDAASGEISPVARKFLGETSQLVTSHARDLTQFASLRARLFGIPDGISGGRFEGSRNKRTFAAPTHREYRYARLGLVVISETKGAEYGDSAPPVSTRLALEFIPPAVP